MKKIININQLDVRVSTYKPALATAVKSALNLSKGRAVAVVHLGYSGPMFMYRNHPDILRFKDCTGFDVYKEDYDIYFSETLRYLHNCNLPLFVFEEPNPLRRFDLFKELAGINEQIITISCIETGNPKPKMDYASGHLLRFHWDALVQVMVALGVSELDFVGEYLVTFCSKNWVPAQDVTTQSFVESMLGMIMNQNSMFCVDASAYYLTGKPKSTIKGRLLYPLTYPGLIKIPGRERLNLETYQALKAQVAE